MLTPEYLDTLPDALVALWQKVEDDILKDIARRIAKMDGIIEAADWQLYRFEQIQALHQDVVGILARYSGKTRAEIRTMLQEAGRETLASDDEVYRSMGFSPSDINTDPALLNLLQAGYRQTWGAWRNLTATTANTVTKQFEDAMDRAWLQVSSGAFDYRTSIRRAVDDLAAGGIKAITYPTGHTDTLEVAARRCVLTGVNQTAAKLQMERADEMGCEFVEVTAHAGARPEHAVWQGKVYHVGGDTWYEGRFYEDFEAATGYGTGPGLCGWNCRHNFYPFFPGISAPLYSEEDLKKLSDPAVYERIQRKNALERKVRDAKRRYLAAKAAGLDTVKEAVRLKKARQALAQYTDETGLRTDSSRTMVHGFGRSAASKAVWEARKGAQSSYSDLHLKGRSVTMTSIANVKAFRCETLDAAGQRALQNAHKRLLLEVAKQPPGTEMARCYGLDMRPLGGAVAGPAGGRKVKIPDFEVPYVAIHSHPSGLTFSPGDIRGFANRENMRMLTAVGNDGHVYAVEKTKRFRRSEIIDLFCAAEEGLAKLQTAQDISDAIQKLLKEAEKYGISYHA